MAIMAILDKNADYGHYQFSKSSDIMNKNLAAYSRSSHLGYQPKIILCSPAWKIDRKVGGGWGFMEQLFCIDFIADMEYCLSLTQANFAFFALHNHF